MLLQLQPNVVVSLVTSTCPYNPLAKALGAFPQRSKKLVLYKQREDEITTLRGYGLYLRLKHAGPYCKDWMEPTMEHNNLTYIMLVAFRFLVNIRKS